jgi:flotillin
MLPLLVAIGGGVLLVLFLVIYILSRIKVAGPNEAFIVTGRKGRRSKAPTARWPPTCPAEGRHGRVRIRPARVQKLQVMSPSSRRIHVEIQGAVSKQGIRPTRRASPSSRSWHEDSIRASAQRFLHQQDQIASSPVRSSPAHCGRSSSAHHRGDHLGPGVQSAVSEEAEHSMTNQGLVLSLQLQDILAEGTYLQDLGRPEAARVMRDAVIAEAKARQEAEQARLIAEEAMRK